MRELVVGGKDGIEPHAIGDCAEADKIPAEVHAGWKTGCRI